MMATPDSPQGISFMSNCIGSGSTKPSPASTKSSSSDVTGTFYGAPPCLMPMRGS